MSLISQEDEESIQNLKDRFVVNGKFRAKRVSDLCVTQLKVALKVRGNKVCIYRNWEWGIS